MRITVVADFMTTRTDRLHQLGPPGRSLAYQEECCPGAMLIEQIKQRRRVSGRAVIDGQPNVTLARRQLPHDGAE
jgi:hypothetical protein